MSPAIIRSFGPLRTWVHPGQEALVEAVVFAEALVAAHSELALLDLDREVVLAHQSVTVGPGSTTLRFRLKVPDQLRHGYGLRLRLDVDGSVVDATSALEVLEGWWQSPRHAAITDYVDAGSTARATGDLAQWHVNVVQHYDWMWRHYRYRPPDGAAVFADALGRSVSHDAVRGSIAAGHKAGIAALAYGSVYGAEPEYIEQHPDERVFDDEGEPLSLGDAFFINDLRPGSPWRARLLDEYAAAIEQFGFDGIHMDTYGPPHGAVAADGEAIDFAALYPGLIEEAASVVGGSAQVARVLFNCVDGFPLEAVAPAPEAALYLELWPPDCPFEDVVRWVDHARSLAHGRQVVIAAYAATLKDEDAVVDRAEAVEPVVLLGSVIAASGAYHHTIAEGERLLVEGYYPAAVRMEPAEAAELKELWRFGARYVHLLSDPQLATVEPRGLRITAADGRTLPWSLRPAAGSIWVRTTQTAAGARVMHLVDLLDQPDTHWDEPKRLPARRTGLRLAWDGQKSAVAASPWTSGGDAVALEARGEGDLLLPAFRRWMMVVVR